MKRAPSSACWMTERRLASHPGCGNRAGLLSSSRMNHPRKNALPSGVRPDACSGCIASRVGVRAKCPSHRCDQVAASIAVARCSLRSPPTNQLLPPDRSWQSILRRPPVCTVLWSRYKIMQSTQRLDDVPQAHSIDIGSKQAVNDQNFTRASVLTELVRCPQHIRGLQRRTHGGEGVRHVVA